MLPAKAHRLKKWLLLSGVMFATSSYANLHLTADIISFEELSVPSWITGSQPGTTLSFSDKRAILGEQSLHWQWQDSSQLRLDNLNITRITDAQAKTAYGSGATQVLSFWIYNEQATPDQMTVQLKDDISGVNTAFPVKLNFTGWRAVGVSLNLDLNEKFTHTSELSSITFTIPNNAGISSKGLYLDRVMVSVDDYRYQWSDDQVTTRFVEPEIDFQLPADLPTPTQQQLDDAEQIKQILIKEFTFSPGSMNKL